MADLDGLQPGPRDHLITRALETLLGAQRVAIIDFDVHHGNGTQECFRTRPDVLTISLHMDHGAWAPSHPQTGTVPGVGEGASDGFNLKLPFPYGTGDAGYARAMREVVAPVVDRYQPDLLIGATGQDASQFDPNGRQTVTMRGFRVLGETLRSIADRSARGAAGPDPGGRLRRDLRRVLPACDPVRRAWRPNRRRRPRWHTCRTTATESRRWWHSPRRAHALLAGALAVTGALDRTSRKEPVMDTQEIVAFLDGQTAQIAAREQDLAFEASEYANRLSRLRSAMEEAELDALVVSAPDAMCWLHGYQSRWYKSHSTTAWPPFQCTVAHVDHDRLLHFDMERHRYLIPRTSVVTDLRLKSANSVDDWLDFFLGELQAEGWLGGTVGIEKWSSVPNRATSEIVEAALTSRGCAVVDGSLVTRRIRRLKSAAEIELMRRAAGVCDAGLRALQAFLAPGVTELEAWEAVMRAMVTAGGEPAALQENVWAGTSQLIHALSSRRRFTAGEIVCADPCGVVHRYHANAARTFSIGEPEPAALNLMDLLAEGAALFEQSAGPGVSVADVQRTLRAFYRDSGVWDRRGWLGGYELGIAFPPDWVGEWMFAVDDADSDDVFEEGLVTNFESVAGLLLIDTFVIGPSGAERLSSVPREVLVAAA